MEILLVEDDKDLTTLTSDALERYGFRVTVANTFHEAHYFLRHRVFDAVLADLFLDETTDSAASWRNLAKLRARAPMLPFGILSGTKVAASDLEAHGITFALHKPVPIDGIVSALTSCVPAIALPPDQQATVRAYFACLERSDWDQLESLCTDGIIYELPADSDKFRASVSGRSAFRRFTEDTFSRFREPRFAVNALRALPRGAVVKYEGSWIEPSGSRTSLPGAVVFRFDGDRIAEIAIRIEPLAA